ncbi:MAG: GNAT family N-acetyltransferase [Nanoarchaeota archaeon]
MALWRLRCSTALVAFITVRPYTARDLEQLIAVYKSAFAEPPWNEYVKCASCNVEYGIVESQSPGPYCKKCNALLELTEYWSSEDIVQDMEFALSQPDPILLVAENSTGLAGFTWGYRLPREKFPFLAGKIAEDTNYMDEISVCGSKRLKGIATQLGSAYLENARAQGMREVVLRTDERNTASMSLFWKLGFSGIPDPGNSRGSVYDPDFQYRIYLKRALGG